MRSEAPDGVDADIWWVVAAGYQLRAYDSRDELLAVLRALFWRSGERARFWEALPPEVRSWLAY